MALDQIYKELKSLGVLKLMENMPNYSKSSSIQNQCLLQQCALKRIFFFLSSLMK
jgi:hypothetical protein